jgi:hypothetical protein
MWIETREHRNFTSNNDQEWGIKQDIAAISRNKMELSNTMRIEPRKPTFGM